MFFSLIILGLFSGILAGFLGIGGGTVLVPIFVALGYDPLHAVATSSFTIVITSISGSLQNWRMGVLSPRLVVSLCLPSLLTAQVGVIIANRLPPHLLMLLFGAVLLLNLYLMALKKQLIKSSSVNRSGSETFKDEREKVEISSNICLMSLSKVAFTGGLAGLLSGTFGIGGGVILVPLQVLLLNQPIKRAIQTSLAVIVITAISATAGHALNGNVLWLPGLLLGIGGFVGAQLSTRFLPRISDRIVSYLFRIMLLALAVYVFSQSWSLSADTNLASKPQANQISFSNTSESSAYSFREAVNAATQAAELVQSAQTAEEWQKVIDSWQIAINLMSDMPPTHPNYRIAQDKVLEYQSYLDYAQKNYQQLAGPPSSDEVSPHLEKQTGLENQSATQASQAVTNSTHLTSFGVAMAVASQASEMVQQAETADDWQDVSQLWQAAVNLLEQVPSSSSSYDMAQQKISEYQRNLQYSEQNH